MRLRTLALRSVDALSSLGLAVAVMLMLGAACIAATFYESKHGTPAAQREFYGTWWFTLLLGMLAVNVLGSMLKRLPWSRHHVGFVLAHVGILLILGGSVVSLFWGLDSQMALYEGDTTDRLTLMGQSLRVGMASDRALSGIDVDFKAHPPGPGHESRYDAPGIGVTLVAEDYLPHARVSQGLEEGTQGGPALHFVIAGPNGQVDDWLVADDPAHASAGLGPLGLSFQAAATPEQVAQVLERGAATNHVALVSGPDGVVSYRLDATGGAGSRGVVELGRPIQTPWMGMTVTVDRLLRHAAAHRSVVPAPLPDNGFWRPWSLWRSAAACCNRRSIV